jgi:hypothetical protein
MNRALVQAGFTVVVFVLLAVTSVLLTNALFKATASDRPTVTFSIVSASPGSAGPPSGAGLIR